ncbi:hypothetical protein BLNAU_20219 [Blattamonas nauphoetae]|uniref:Uncharacterized protein n=1 Tax=Blattamonas nauphoetae TaxID=2049346 RepID=A0ABQ9X2N4_9EUKA|nr:hypothetical protein BLNAU_20219 [Blattamonas nauphoetae]
MDERSPLWVSTTYSLPITYRVHTCRNLDDLKDSEDMYMNGLRANVLTVDTQMPALVFSDPSHFRMEDNIIASKSLATEEKIGRIQPTWSSFFISEPITEGIVAISVTFLMDFSIFFPFFIGLLDGTEPIPEKGQTLGDVKNSIALSSRGNLHFTTAVGKDEINIWTNFQTCDTVVVEIDLDSNPRTAQFFINRKSTDAIVVGLPESVRVGFSSKDPGMIFRFDRITHLNRGCPFTDLMTSVEWPRPEPLQKSESKEDSGAKEETTISKQRINENNSPEKERSTESEKDDDQPSKTVLDEANGKPGDDGEESSEDSDEDTDDGKSQIDSDSDNEDDRTDLGRKTRQLPTMKLPDQLFTDKSHFRIRNNLLTRTEKGTDKKERTRPSTVLFSDSITKGIVSVTFVVLTLAESVEQKGFINFGLLDAQTDVPRLGRVLGKDVKHSIALSTRGEIHVFCLAKLEEKSHYFLSRKDRVVMEVNMESNPRTVQFFVNGKTAACYVSGIPESVRIGFSADVLGTSLEIASIVHSTQATPVTNKMKEIKWTDTEFSNYQINSINSQQIWRASEGTMPTLLIRNPEHFKIEGNVITRTAFDYDGLNSPFSTVMLDGAIVSTIAYVAITILALPQSDDSCGIIMIGCLRTNANLPKSPKGLGIGTKHSIALCSSDGVLFNMSSSKSGTNSCHNPLQVGDQIVLEVNALSDPDLIRFFVNGKAGQSEISETDEHMKIGVCSF